MIPIADTQPANLRFPLFNLALILACVLVFLQEAQLPEPALQLLIQTYGVVPGELTSGRDLPPLTPIPLWATLITSMFLHGGWLHLAGNMLYLWVFGDNVEHALGHRRYLLFYLACGVIAGWAQVAVAPASTVPMVGASGAIAGVLGAYLVLYPGAQVTVLVLGVLPRVVPVPAALLIGLWAFLQLYTGLGALGVETQPTGGVAYWAHIGGFVAGVLYGLLLGRRAPGPLLPARKGSPAAQIEAWSRPATKADVAGVALTNPSVSRTGDGGASQGQTRRRLAALGRPPQERTLHS